MKPILSDRTQFKSGIINFEPNFVGFKLNNLVHLKKLVFREELLVYFNEKIFHLFLRAYAAILRCKYHNEQYMVVKAVKKNNQMDQLDNHYNQEKLLPDSRKDAIELTKISRKS